MPFVNLSHKGLTCIYGIKCTATNKVYIGQTWNLHHRYKSNVITSCRGLYRSLKKHGEENHQLFTIVEMKGDFTQSDLDYWEKHYVGAYKAAGYELLNIREAGSRGKNSVETRKKISEKRAVWISANPDKVREIALNASRSNIGIKRSEQTRRKQSNAAAGRIKTAEHCEAISQAKKGKPSPMKGRQFSATARANIAAAAKARDNQGIAVKQYNLNGSFVKEWPSIKEASAFFGMSKGTISGCVRKAPNYKTAAGFIWQYADDLTPIIPENHVQTYNSKKTPVAQIAADGAEVARFDTIKGAASSTGTDRSGIFACLKGKRKQAGGYVWRYAS